MSTAKLFLNGKSQAIRLPKKYRFNAKEVSIIPFGKGVIIQPIIDSWDEVFENIKLAPQKDFLLDREDYPAQTRESMK